MTREEILYLASFEKNFTTAINSNWSSAVPVKDLKKMLEIMKNIEPGYTANINCSRCVLGLLKKLGAEYFSAVKETEGTEPTEENANTDTTETVSEEVVSDKVRKNKRRK